MAAAVLKALQCPCFGDCARYVCNSMHLRCRSSVCGCSCPCDTDPIAIQEEKASTDCFAGLVEHFCSKKVKANACDKAAEGHT